MSFGVSTADGAFEWGSYSLRSFISSISLLLELWFWRLLFDVLRFSLVAENILHESNYHTRPWYHPAEKEPSDMPTMGGQLESIGQYLSRKTYSEHFMTYFLIPMMAAPWCIDPHEFARTFPAKPLIQFM
jgi:predicted NAD/FAD-binding protein